VLIILAAVGGTMTRTKKQLGHDRVRLQNQLEGFLEEGRIKLSSHVSDLMQAFAEGETDAAKIAALATHGLKASREGTAGRAERGCDAEPAKTPDSEAVSGKADTAGNTDRNAGKERRGGAAAI
jgi:hypothetical protein